MHIEAFAPPTNGFLNHIKQSSYFAWIALIIAVVYFIAIHLLYPVPGYFTDSFTFVSAAANNDSISFRPILYSKLVRLARCFSTSEMALIALQYGSMVLANLFLFFTTTWFFQFKKTAQWVLFLLLIAHPFYVFASNYVSSDAFFTSFTVAWLTLLIWIMYKPRWYFLLIHLVLLTGLFLLRYNAIFYPLLTSLAIVCTRLNWWRKAALICTSWLLIVACIEVTTSLTKKITGIQMFSPFGGWQLANNALNIIQAENVSDVQIQDSNVVHLLNYCKHYFDTAKGLRPGKGTSWYMWAPASPLKQYMKVLPGNNGYFTKWVKLGPRYADFGETIIRHNPGAYLTNFVLPNAKAYLFPPLEVYANYFIGVDTLPKVVQQYFSHASNKVSNLHPTLHAAVFTPLPWVFTLSHFGLFLLALAYVVTKTYRSYSLLCNRFLLLFAGYVFINFIFIIFLAPSVFRYHTPVLILLFPVVLFMGAAMVKSAKHKAIR